jgi:hypothetical protein
VILSSSDIFRILSSDPVIRVSARVKIVDTRPPIETADSTVIYIAKYPIVSDFQAVWTVWIADNSNEPLDLILAQLKRLLPGFQITDNGIIVKATVTELKSANTETAPVIPAKQDQGLLSSLQAKFDELKQSIEDRMLLVGPGRAGKEGIPGRDGANGSDGKDGRDGKDLIATDAELDDLKDVFTTDAQRGQFLMFDGASWVARFVPQIIRASGGGGGGGTGGGIEEAPLDGNYYVRQNGQWVNLVDALADLGNIDAGDFTTGVADTNNSSQFDGGDFSP